VGWNNEDGTFALGPGFGEVGVRTSGGFVGFDRFNVAPQMDEASFFNPGVMPAAAGAALDALELVVRGGVVVERREGSWNNHFIPEGSAMIVARGRSRALLENYREGDPIEIAANWETASFRSCTNMIQAGPLLLRNNQMLSDNETLKSDVTDKRHPRTIVGSDGERIMWAVIDGRSSIHSRGATIDETRWVARALGLSNALNLDGGGSSELIWRGVIVNSPSDGHERPLPYAVLMMPKGAEMTRKNFEGYYDYGGLAAAGEAYGQTTDDELEAVYMDTYNPQTDSGDM
jgi:hypothetical protein